VDTIARMRWTDAEIPQHISQAFATTHPSGSTDWTIYGGGDDLFLADAADVGLFKGTMEALEQLSIEKGCNIQFQHG